MTQTINLKADATETDVRAALAKVAQTGGTLVFAKTRRSP